MRVIVERSGGFAGTRKESAVDSQSLSAGESADLQKLVDAAGFFDLPEKPAEAPQGADQFQYKLTVETPQRQRTLVVTEPPPELKRLLDWVLTRYR